MSQSDNQSLAISRAQCHPECANSTGCTGPLASECDACRHVRLISGDCVARCSFRTFLNESSSLCSPCYERCNSCVGPLDTNCTSCRIGSYFLPKEGRCLQMGEACPIGHFNDLHGVCQPCRPNCAACHSAQTPCLRCRSDVEARVLTIGGSCTKVCPAKHFAKEYWFRDSEKNDHKTRDL